MPSRMRYVIRASDTTPEDEDRRSFTRNYILANGFEFWIAAAAVLSAVAFFIDPSSLAETPVGAQVPFAAAAFWNALYLLGGLWILTGLVWPGHIRWELAGLSLLGSGIVVNGLAAVVLRGVYPGTFTLFGLALACGMRAWLLIKLTRRMRRAT